MEDKLEGRTELIAGINHMAWLLDIHDKNGVDLYPEIKKAGGGEEHFRRETPRYGALRVHPPSGLLLH